jgi:hypothetical protein
MLPNEIVLAPLQKMKIIYKLFYQSTTRLIYIDTFNQLLIIHQWTSTVDNTVRSLIHFTIFIWYYVVKHFPSFIKSSLNNWCPIKMFILLHVWILFTWHRLMSLSAMTSLQVAQSSSSSHTHRVMMKNPIIFWKPIIRFCFWEPLYCNVFYVI